MPAITTAAKQLRPLYLVSIVVPALRSRHLDLFTSSPRSRVGTQNTVQRRNPPPL